MNILEIGQNVGYMCPGLNVPTEVYKLRYSVFVEKLKWIPPNDSGLEKDEYDKDAQIIYVVNKNTLQVIGTVRILDSHNIFMMEKDFKFLINKKTKYLRTDFSAEISRLAIENISKKDHMGVIRIIFKFVEEWARNNHKNLLYLVTTDGYAKKLSLGYSLILEKISDSSYTDDGIPYSAYCLDIGKSLRLA